MAARERERVARDYERDIKTSLFVFFFVHQIFVTMVYGSVSKNKPSRHHQEWQESVTRANRIQGTVIDMVRERDLFA